MASASSVKVQRLRPAGGLAHAVATSRASSLPVSLRSAPGRGSSLKARSRLPSTKRRLVRLTVERLTRTVRTISASQLPASVISSGMHDATARHGHLEPAACRPRALLSVRSVQLGSIRPDNVHSCFASLSEAGTNPAMSQKSGARLTQKQGHYLAFIHTYSYSRPPKPTSSVISASARHLSTR